ncbi:MAG TPA: alkaline phosphatase family protein [Acidimicrobiia bacterium]
MAEIEKRMGSEPPHVRLRADLAALIPDARSYVMMLLDGLGDGQLGHPAAAALAECRVGALDAPFPSTTTVSLATIVTGTGPKTHGLIAHLMHLPQLGRVINTLKWVDLTGAPAELDTTDFLPGPNLWERLAVAGAKCVTIQPADFAPTPTTRALYRGCHFVGAGSPAEFVSATIAAASEPGTLVFTYVPPVDYAAHVFGQRSAEYGDAVNMAVGIWGGIARQLPTDVTMVGTADHGVIDVEEANKVLVRDDLYRPLEFYGDPRGVMVRGSSRLIERLAAETGCQHVDRDSLVNLLGPGPHHRWLDARLPDSILLAPPGSVLLPPGFDKRLRGYHGGLTRDELAIPLLVAG